MTVIQRHSASIRAKIVSHAKRKELRGLVLFFTFALATLIIQVISKTASKPTPSNNEVGNLSNRRLSRFPLIDNVPKIPEKITAAIDRKRKQLRNTLEHLSSSTGSADLPEGLAALRGNHQNVGEPSEEIKNGAQNIYDVVNEAQAAVEEENKKAPMEIEEIIDYLENWLSELHVAVAAHQHEDASDIWQAFHDLAVETLLPWDQDYLTRMPPRRDDGSIFLSVASYRDVHCLETVHQAYLKAKHPGNLYVGLVQQNCHKDCLSGVLENLTKVEVPPDDDCYTLFCATDIGKAVCDRNQFRVLNVDEPESLGPYAARYFASKLWNGEQWFMQIDSHMTFLQDWDSVSIQMLNKAPSKKPVLTQYPPEHDVDLSTKVNSPASRICDLMISPSKIEAQIVKLDGAALYDKEQLEYPPFAPATAAGYFVAHSDFLREVPFDPMLPWVFMGEEIIMSSRLFTAGYDIFAPTQPVVGHWYGRKHTPKFWESVNRATSGVFNGLQRLILERIKHQMGYPEATSDMVSIRSIVTGADLYGMGTERPLEQYLKMVGLDFTAKEHTEMGWCKNGVPPPGFEQYNDLYPNSRNKTATSVETANK